MVAAAALAGAWGAHRGRGRAVTVWRQRVAGAGRGAARSTRDRGSPARARPWPRACNSSRAMRHLLAACLASFLALSLAACGHPPADADPIESGPGVHGGGPRGALLGRERRRAMREVGAGLRAVAMTRHARGGTGGVAGQARDLRLTAGEVGAVTRGAHREVPVATREIGAVEVHARRIEDAGGMHARLAVDARRRQLARLGARRDRQDHHRPPGHGVP